MTTDESTIAYQPSFGVKVRAEKRGEPIPVMFIKRKPHPNCLVIYQSMTYIEHPIRNSKLPFIVDMLPHLQVGDVNPILAVKQTMQR